MLILVPVEDFDGCVFVYDQQDEFLMEMQMRLHSEITQHCLANAGHSRHAMEALPAEADGGAYSMTTA
ncbi:hypothetical protein ABVT39_012642 [Epinephelus coioides]